MKCMCGHLFTLERDLRPRPDNYAVIRDNEYKKVLRIEVKVLNAKDKLARLAAITRAARYVGSMRTCPDCGRLVFLTPGGDEVPFFKQEKSPARRKAKKEDTPGKKKKV